MWMTVMHQETCLAMANGDPRIQTLSYTGWKISTFKNGLKIIKMVKISTDTRVSFRVYSDMFHFPILIIFLRVNMIDILNHPLLFPNTQIYAKK